MSPSERAQILAMLSALVEPLHLSIPGSNEVVLHLSLIHI